VLRQVAISFLVAALVIPAAARTRPHYGGTVRVEVEGDPWQRPGGLARRLVFDGLTAMSADGTPRPALALDWKSENDDRRWQFRLRSGVRFHDGSPLTSPSVVASLVAVCNTNCPWTAVRVAGSSVVFTGDSPMPNLPALLAGDDFRISSASTNGAGGVVGTGPFQTTGFANGVLTLTANDSGWQSRPFVDSVEIRVRRSIHDQWLDLSVNRADLVEVPAEQLHPARDQHLTVLASPPVTLLALQLSSSGVLGDPNLRAAIALAVDRGVLFNVIFQKQGEVTASLLPSALTGYAFLFPTGRDLNKADELRGSITPPPLTLAVEGGSALQLAAQRIALNLREAGFTVQVVNAASASHPDLRLRRFSLECSQPSAALESILHAAGQAVPLPEQSLAATFKAEHDFLNRNILIPLLYLPRAYASGGRLRDLRFAPDGAPDLAQVSLEDAP
jgi:MarR-like DNA-binding transcriptional regulator SgrR of sgrS sRNA